MNVVPAQVAGVRVAGGRHPAAGGVRRAAAPGGPRRVRAARRRRGLRRRRRAGGRDVRLRHRRRARRSTWSPVPATSTSPPPSGCSRASSASTPRPARPRSRSSPTTAPTRRTSPPTSIAQAEHDPNASCLLVTPSAELLDAVDVELAAQVRRDAAPRAGRGGAARPVGVRPGRRPRRRGWRSSTRGRPSTSRSSPATPAPWADRVRNAGAIFVGAYSPVSLGDYLAGSNHVLPTGGTARHTGGLSVAVLPARHPRRRVRPGGAGRGRATTSTRSAAPRTWRRTSPPFAVRVPQGRHDGGRDRQTAAPRRPARAARRTARRSSTSRCG